MSKNIDIGALDRKIQDRLIFIHDLEAGKCDVKLDGIIIATLNNVEYKRLMDEIIIRRDVEKTLLESEKKAVIKEAEEIAAGGNVQ